MVIKIDRAAAKKHLDEADRLDIFELDDAVYSIPVVDRSEVALRYLQIANDESEDKANYYLLTEMLGQEGFDALRSVDGLRQEDFDEVIAKVSSVVMPRSNPKGRRG